MSYKKEIPFSASQAFTFAVKLSTTASKKRWQMFMTVQILKVNIKINYINLIKKLSWRVHAVSHRNFSPQNKNPYEFYKSSNKGTVWYNIVRLVPILYALTDMYIIIMLCSYIFLNLPISVYIHCYIMFSLLSFTVRIDYFSPTVSHTWSQGSHQYFVLGTSIMPIADKLGSKSTKRREFLSMLDE